MAVEEQTFVHSNPEPKAQVLPLVQLRYTQQRRLSPTRSSHVPRECAGAGELFAAWCPGPGDMFVSDR